MIKERPIIFSGPMVRAILDGRKTQTRREIKFPRRFKQIEFLGGGGDDWNDPSCWGYELECGEFATLKPEPNDLHVPRRYGKPGDRLWVRETVQIYGHWQKNGITNTGRQKWKFKPHHRKKVLYQEAFEPKPKSKDLLGYWTRPSIHMPRWASRILLEITAIRVEQLQDISEGDALAEGFSGRITDGLEFPSEQFHETWESLHGPKSWAKNPWVWVIEFQRIMPKEGKTDE